MIQRLVLTVIACAVWALPVYADVQECLADDSVCNIIYIPSIKQDSNSPITNLSESTADFYYFFNDTGITGTQLTETTPDRINVYQIGTTGNYKLSIPASSGVTVSGNAGKTLCLYVSGYANITTNRASCVYLKTKSDENTVARMPTSGTLPITTTTMAANVTQWNGTAVATPDTAGFPKVTIKDGTGPGEIDTLGGAIVNVDLTDTATALTNAVNLPAIPADWITAAGVADALESRFGYWGTVTVAGSPAAATTSFASTSFSSTDANGYVGFYAECPDASKWVEITRFDPATDQVFIHPTQACATAFSGTVRVMIKPVTTR